MTELLNAYKAAEMEGGVDLIFIYLHLQLFWESQHRFRMYRPRRWCSVSEGAYFVRRALQTERGPD
jgi:hypothetical protein